MRELHRGAWPVPLGLPGSRDASRCCPISDRRGPGDACPAAAVRWRGSSGRKLLRTSLASAVQSESSAGERRASRRGCETGGHVTASQHLLHATEPEHCDLSQVASGTSAPQATGACSNQGKAKDHHVARNRYVFDRLAIQSEEALRDGQQRSQAPQQEVPIQKRLLRSLAMNQGGMQHA